MNNCTIIGVGQTGFSPENRFRSMAELALEAVERALEDAQLDIKDVDNVVTASVDLWDGKTASNIALTEVVGAVMKPEARVAGDGILAAIHAAAGIMSGQYGTALVLASCKPLDGEHQKITNWTFDPVYQQTLGLDDLIAAGLQANAFMKRSKITHETLSEVVMKNHSYGELNPRTLAGSVHESGPEVYPSEAGKHLSVRGLKVANLQKYISEGIERSLSGRLAKPLRTADVAPLADGAAALILCREDRAPSAINGRPTVKLKGMGHAMDVHYLGDRDLSESMAMRNAAKMAYKMADISDPGAQIDLAEISEPFSYVELLAYEGLGFCGRGEAGEMLNNGSTLPMGSLPVNPSGGMLSGIPPFVAGLNRIIEATLQLRGEAGEEIQVKHEPRVALAHGSHGPAGQCQGVVILASEAKK